MSAGGGLGTFSGSWGSTWREVSTNLAEGKMAELKSGSVTVQLEDALLAAQAGKLSQVEVKRTPKGRRGQDGIATACEQASHDLEQADPAFVPPVGVSVASLTEMGRRVRELDKTIRDAEVVVSALRQSRLLLVADADKQLRQLNDQVKAQGKFLPQLLLRFARLLSFFSRPRRTPELQPAPTPPATTPAVHPA